MSMCLLHLMVEWDIQGTDTCDGCGCISGAPTYLNRHRFSVWIDCVGCYSLTKDPHPIYWLT